MIEQVTAVGPDDRYRLERRIATGGMGVVWEATDTLLDREVAVKILKNEYADDPTFRTRFEAEARHAASLHHPHIASVFDFGELTVEDGSGSTCPFLVMELVPGRPLSALLRESPAMAPEVAADLVAQAAEAIGAAHAMGIVHRDVKPANLLVTPSGELKITDFGIARAGDAPALTQTGQIVGTPHYLSPEQADGRPATEASDVYALGVVLYECLAGRPPFVGDTPVTIALAHLRQPPPPLPADVPLHLRQVVTKALAKDPAERFVTALDLARALRGGAIVGAVPPETAVFTVPEAAEGHRSGPPPWLPLAAAGIGALLLFVPLALGVGGGTEPVTPPEDAATGVVDQQPVRVRSGALVGLDAEVVANRLTGMGLQVTEEKQANPGGHRPGTVAAVTPHGLVDPSSTITMFVWAEPRRPAADDEGEDGEDADEEDAEPVPAEGKPGKGPSEHSGKGKGKAGNGKGKKR